MSRLIDADALIQLLRTIANDDWNKNTPAGTWSNAYEEIILHVEDAPTIEPDLDEAYRHGETEAEARFHAQQRWIPCSERLPNCNGIYIVTRIMSDGFECCNIVDACYFDGTDTWHDDTRVNHGRKYLTDVVTWMPLPEPYREGDC